ncbi:hypothetical protein [Mucilaginibacter sp.]|uniref:hypothetical protein n=1 Tax=Mucilaginibacter sp. TaxID=1882438 RepID=UPI00283D00A4|nr:hypothetical protein [Mucilaginibacter sp.]MDR3695638.1 hypothetical protein [Mucilaginibacter sp.]
MAYNDAIVTLEKKLFSFDPQSERVYHLINELKDFAPVEQVQPLNDTPKTSIDLDKIVSLIFDKDAPVTDLVLFTLHYSNVVLKVKDIESVIRKFYPAFDKGLSTPIFKLKDSDVIDTYNPTTSNRSVYYGLKSWFKEPGKVKEEYLTDEIKWADI